MSHASRRQDSTTTVDAASESFLLTTLTAGTYLLFYIMSETKSEVLTFDNYLKYRLVQDKDVGREFERLRTKIEEGNKSLRVELTTTEGTLSGGLNRLNNELGKVKVDLQNLKDEVSQVKAGLDQLSGRSYNKMRFLPQHNIAKIGAYRPATGFEMPSYFPGTINEFWKLRLQQNG